MAKWMVYTKKADFRAIAQECGISQVLARLIRNRDIIGVEETRRFLKGNLADLHDPCLLPDMEKAVGILSTRIRDGASVRVIGDYDVDGICASYILMRTLEACGAKADVVLPDRVRDGYGMNPRMSLDAARDGVGVILTCDNGIAAAEAVRTAKEAGICVVVTDHHEVPFEEEADGTRRFILPPADAVVDPKVRDPQTGETVYPFPEICGAVVAWKLADLLLQELAPDSRSRVLRDLLPFCALATVCDVMPLLDENRILVKKGLEAAASTANIGLRSLLIVNLRSAQKLRELNDSRKSLTEQGVDMALKQVSEQHLLDHRVLVIYLPDCHESLAGIIAGRIRERFCRPVFVLTRTEEGLVKGSGRSIEAYDMFASMTAVKDCFVKFGGHKMAAGLSMEETMIRPLQELLEEHCCLREEDLTDVLHIDMELPPGLWTREMTEELSLLDPCGTSNPKPMFVARGIRLHGIRIMGKGRNVLRLEAAGTDGRSLPLIRFQEDGIFREELTEAAGRPAWEALLRGYADIPVSMVYYPQINEWRGRKTLQFVVRDIHY